ncbi:MAG: HigA family addiction module antidote protein [Desulfobacteraceae bacterium]|nr:HigA family addiction module antidote protein [Desulfobacteraceae bacterium]
MTKTPTHPGEILASELDELKMSAAEMARQIKVPANRITQILACKRSVTADTALRLGKLLGTGPRLWLNLQQTYDLEVAEKKLGGELNSIKTQKTA